MDDPRILVLDETGQTLRLQRSLNAAGAIDAGSQVGRPHGV